MPGHGLGIALVQAQQIPAHRGIEVRRLHVVGQIRLLRPRRPPLEITSSRTARTFTTAPPVLELATRAGPAPLVPAPRETTALAAPGRRPTLRIIVRTIRTGVAGTPTSRRVESGTAASGATIRTPGVGTTARVTTTLTAAGGAAPFAATTETAALGTLALTSAAGTAPHPTAIEPTTPAVVTIRRTTTEPAALRTSPVVAPIGRTVPGAALGRSTATEPAALTGRTARETAAFARTTGLAAATETTLTRVRTARSAVAAGPIRITSTSEAAGTLRTRITPVEAARLAATEAATGTTAAFPTPETTALVATVAAAFGHTAAEPTPVAGFTAPEAAAIPRGPLVAAAIPTAALLVAAASGRITSLPTIRLATAEPATLARAARSPGIPIAGGAAVRTGTVGAGTALTRIGRAPERPPTVIVFGHGVPFPSFFSRGFAGPLEFNHVPVW